MLKYLIAAAVALTPSVASAQTISISLNRHALIKEAAKTICRASIDRPGKAGDIMDQESAYLRLTQDEKLYLVSLCILYTQGRIDEGR